MTQAHRRSLPEWWSKQDDRELLECCEAKGGTVYTVKKNAEDFLASACMKVSKLLDARSMSDAAYDDAPQPYSPLPGHELRKDPIIPWLTNADGMLIGACTHQLRLERSELSQLLWLH